MCIEYRRAGTVTIEMLLLTLALFTFVLLADALGRIRRAEARTKRDVHQELFARLLSGTMPGGFIDADADWWRVLFPPDAVDFEIDGGIPDGLDISDLDNDVVQRFSSRATRVYVGPYGDIPPVTYQAAVMGIETPWGYSAEMISKAQSWFEANHVRDWYKSGMDESIGDYEDGLQLAEE